jgi:ubiquinone/menaquinone biosynthesis C-methylase UbiE
MSTVPNPFEAPGKFYDYLAENIRDPRFVFMNYGYSNPNGLDDFSWMDPPDQIWKYSINLLKRLVGQVDIRDKRVLDVGCGRGGNVAALARYLGAAEVVGLDLSVPAIASAHESVDNPRANFVVGDALLLPFVEQRFDVITNIESAQHYPDKGRFFDEVRRVLVPRGYFCITDFSMDVAEMESLVQRVDFEVVEFEDISEGAQRAVALCKKERVELLREFVASGTASSATADWMIAALEGHVPDEDVFYHRWILRKKN